MGVNVYCTFQKISIPSLHRVNGNTKGEGAAKARGQYGLNWNFQRGGSANQKPSV